MISIDEVVQNEVSRFSRNSLTIDLKASQKFQVEIRGSDIGSGEEVCRQTFRLNKEESFSFKANHNQRLRFKLIVRKGKRYVYRYYYLSGTALERIPSDRIAHGMGAVNGVVYTNSKEAFDQNYAKGLRVFEVDVQLTRDARVVLFHDAKDYQGKKWLKQKIKKVRSKVLRSFRYEDKYSVLFIEDLVDLLTRHRDSYFVLDIKSGYLKFNALLDFIVRMFRSYKKRLSVDGNNLTDIFERVFGHKRLGLSDSLVFRVLVDLSHRNPALLDRVIPQVNLNNIELVYDHYDFPLKLWRDGKSAIEQDIANMAANSISNYSLNGKRVSEEVLSRLKSEDIYLYLYNAGDSHFDEGRFVD